MVKLVSLDVVSRKLQNLWTMLSEDLLSVYIAPISLIKVATMYAPPSAYLDWYLGRHFSLTSMNGLVSCGSGHHLQQAEPLFTKITWQLILKLRIKTHHHKLMSVFLWATTYEVAHTNPLDVFFCYLISLLSFLSPFWFKFKFILLTTPTNLY